ncbi:IGPS domain-containing protein [Haematococcus lacustris]|uniref:indole-3-glycerol-phosphate synthase n=1 Tax=Haematococcus lacustris TaxID=44745 RepID=A0A699YZ24_HAELA|nr:IGPS domain-containing protein [Haematococcus lacustris]
MKGRKQAQVESVLKELGMEALEERLQSAAALPARPAYRLTSLIAESAPRGKAVLVWEVVRPGPASSPADLARLARQYVSLGADALAVRTDAADSPSALADLWAVTQAVKVPVLARDWVIHPLQVVDAKEAGAAGVLGVIHQDAPVEVVNAQEMDSLSRAGVAFFGINLSIGLSLPISGFAEDVAHGLLGRLPFGAVSLVGVKTIDEARTARQSGADALLIKQELIAAHSDAAAAKEAASNPFAMSGLRRLTEELQYVTSGDE